MHISIHVFFRYLKTFLKSIFLDTCLHRHPCFPQFSPHPSPSKEEKEEEEEEEEVVVVVVVEAA